MDIKPRVLFYYLSAFSNTGGIEKFNRCFIKALNDIAEQGSITPSVVGVYDTDADPLYIKPSYFLGFRKKRGPSVFHVIRAAFRTDILILGHINLAVAGWIVKLIRPSCKVFIVAHGIEVWNKMHLEKRWALKLADKILCVSNYTKNQLVLKNGIHQRKLLLFPNTIDPYFVFPAEFDKPEYLLQRYGLTSQHKVIMTLSRLVSSEKYKGYDRVIAALPAILKMCPDAVYILAGKYDDGEKKRLGQLLEIHGLTDKVIMTGYLPDSEVTDHYRLSDVFIMPSRKEGFGIVFLEALVSGVRVVGGNQDGTVDALVNGALGTLINPSKISEISDAVIDVLNSPAPDPIKLQESVLHYYRYEKYRSRLKKYLEEEL